MPSRSIAKRRVREVFARASFNLANGHLTPAEIHAIRSRLQFPPGKPVFSGLSRGRGGYSKISIGGKGYMLHRVVYFVVQRQMDQVRRSGDDTKSGGS